MFYLLSYNLTGEFECVSSLNCPNKTREITIYQRKHLSGWSHNLSLRLRDDLGMVEANENTKLIRT